MELTDPLTGSGSPGDTTPTALNALRCLEFRSCDVAIGLMTGFRTGFGFRGLGLNVDSSVSVILVSVATSEEEDDVMFGYKTFRFFLLPCFGSGSTGSCFFVDLDVLRLCLLGAEVTGSEGRLSGAGGALGLGGAVLGIFTSIEAGVTGISGTFFWTVGRGLYRSLNPPPPEPQISNNFRL